MNLPLSPAETHRAVFDQGCRRVLAVGAAAADPGLPAELPAAGDDLFRLWRAWTHRCQPRHVDQGAVDIEPGRTGGNRGLAQPALDREDGVRRTGGLRSHLRLATQGLRPHRRRRHGRRHAHARRCRRRMDRVRSTGSPLYPRRDADRDRHRHPGRRRRRDVDRSRLPARQRRQTSSRGGGARRAWAWSR